MIEKSNAFISSREIAETYNKTHSNVLKFIYNLEYPSDAFVTQNIAYELFEGSRGRKFKEVFLTLEGFVYVLMHMSGYKSSIIKEKLTSIVAEKIRFSKDYSEAVSAYMDFEVVKSDKPTYVYVVVSGKNVKIGRSGNLDERIKCIRTSNPEAELFASFLFSSQEEASFVETTQHRQFKDSHVGGEWFCIDPKVAERSVEIMHIGLVQLDKTPPATKHKILKEM